MNLEDLGETRELEAYFDRLWPLLRSITGEGVRATHAILSEIIPLTRYEIPSGTRVFDWTVPREWHVRDAYVTAPDGKRLFDVRENNLHLLNYAAPFSGSVSRAELDRHLHSLPELPYAIPYVTSYYQERWGFCCAHSDRMALQDGTYEVVIDSELFEGSLTLGDAFLPGDSKQEVLFSSYSCHPSLANNELSGPLVLAALYRRIAAWPKRRFSYRFVLAPETIGSLSYLAMYGRHLVENLVAGYVVTCVGTESAFRFKRTRRGDSLADRAAELVLEERSPGGCLVEDFRPDRGSDERQYNSPGFNLPVGAIMRCPPSGYPEYHSSADNKELISFPVLVETADSLESIARALEENRRHYNACPHGEPQLGRRGLYGTLGDRNRPRDRKALMWVLNYSDGGHDLFDIARLSGHSWREVRTAAARLREAGLLAGAPKGPAAGLEDGICPDQFKVRPTDRPWQAEAGSARAAVGAD